jgi:hypothetical protein
MYSESISQVEVGAGAGSGSGAGPSFVSSLPSAFSHQSGCAVNWHVSLTFTAAAAPHREAETARTTTRPRRQAAPAGEAMSIGGQSEPAKGSSLFHGPGGALFISCSVRSRGFPAAGMHACRLVEGWRTSQASGGRPFHEVNEMFSILTQ